METDAYTLKAFLYDTFMSFSSSHYISLLLLTACHTVSVWRFSIVFRHKHWPGKGLKLYEQILANSDVFTVAGIWRRCCPPYIKTQHLDPTHRDDLFILGLSQREGGWCEGARKGNRKGLVGGGDTKINEYLGNLEGPKQTPHRGPGLRA